VRRSRRPDAGPGRRRRVDADRDLHRRQEERARVTAAGVRPLAAALSYPVAAVLLLALAPVHGGAAGTGAATGALLGVVAGVALFGCLARRGCVRALRARPARRAAASLL